MIQSLYEHAEVKARVASADRLLVFLDFDGTLAPIVDRPERARLDAATREALMSLVLAGNIQVVILSGRSYVDLRARVGIDSLIYGADHGLEIHGPGINFVDARALAVQQDLQTFLESHVGPNLGEFPGARLEAKALTASIHFRLCAESDVPELRAFLTEALRPFAGRLDLAEGKKVFEILPRTSWNKGAAAQWILMRPENYTALVLCFGDDRTDEDVFRALPDAITVKIGRDAPTAAKYRLDGPEQVQEFLVWLGQNSPVYPVAA